MFANLAHLHICALFNQFLPRIKVINIETDLNHEQNRWISGHIFSTVEIDCVAPLSIFPDLIMFLNSNIYILYLVHVVFLQILRSEINFKENHALGQLFDNLHYKIVVFVIVNASPFPQR